MNILSDKCVVIFVIISEQVQDLMDFKMTNGAKLVQKLSLNFGLKIKPASVKIAGNFYFLRKIRIQNLRILYSMLKKRIKRIKIFMKIVKIKDLFKWIVNFVEQKIRNGQILGTEIANANFVKQ